MKPIIKKIKSYISDAPVEVLPIGDTLVYSYGVGKYIVLYKNAKDLSLVCERSVPSSLSAEQSSNINLSNWQLSFENLVSFFYSVCPLANNMVQVEDFSNTIVTFDANNGGLSLEVQQHLATVDIDGQTFALALIDTAALDLVKRVSVFKIDRPFMPVLMLQGEHFLDGVSYIHSVVKDFFNVDLTDVLMEPQYFDIGKHSICYYIRF